MEKPVSIHIKNLRLRTIIGTNDWERTNKQDVVISITFTYDASRAVLADDIEHAVNYKKLTKRIITVVEQSEYTLLESLAHAILAMLDEDPSIREAEVVVEKPHALRFCDTVTCTIRK